MGIGDEGLMADDGGHLREVVLHRRRQLRFFVGCDKGNGLNAIATSNR